MAKDSSSNPQGSGDTPQLILSPSERKALQEIFDESFLLSQKLYAIAFRYGGRKAACDTLSHCTPHVDDPHNYRDDPRQHALSALEYLDSPQCELLNWNAIVAGCSYTSDMYQNMQESEFYSISEELEALSMRILMQLHKLSPQTI